MAMPHLRQWCRRFKRENFSLHNSQFDTCELGVHMGAKKPPSSCTRAFSFLLASVIALSHASRSLQSAAQSTKDFCGDSTIMARSMSSMLIRGGTGPIRDATSMISRCSEKRPIPGTSSPYKSLSENNQK